MTQPGGRSPHPQAGVVLKALREERGLSQEELAETIGCEVKSLRRWEQGKCVPQPQNLRSLADALGRGVKEIQTLIQTGILRKEETTFHQEVMIGRPDSQSPGFTVSDAGSKETLDSIFWYQALLPNFQAFYGRARERETVRSNIRRGISTSIIGPRRIGKTWLMSYIHQEHLLASDRQFSVGFVDTTEPSCATPEGFLHAVLEAFLLPGAESGASSTDLHHPKMGMLLLENRVKKLRADKVLPLLCIDEFEGFCKHPQQFPADFFTQLRAVAQRGLVLITASKEPLIDIVRKTGQTSPFFNIFDMLYLRAFSQEEARKFFEEKSARTSFSDDDHQQLLRIARDDQGRWPPARLQLAGQQLLSDYYFRDYHRGDHRYWQTFGERLEEAYRATGA